MAIKRLKKTRWGQWSLALTVFDGTILEIIVLITSVVGLIGFCQSDFQ